MSIWSMLFGKRDPIVSKHTLCPSCSRRAHIFTSMSEICDEGDKLAHRLATLLTFDDLKLLHELVEANSINQDFECSLYDEIANWQGPSPP